MKRHAPLTAGLGLAAAAAVALTACEPQQQEGAQTELEGTTEQPGLTADTAGMQPDAIYEARLEGLQGSGASGTATVTVRDDEVQVTVAALGLEPNTVVPQHIHVNATCDNAGGILLNLDEELTLAGQAEPRGDAYPQTNDQGSLRYEASRSLGDLSTAMGSDTAGMDGQATATPGDGTAAGRTAQDGTRTDTQVATDSLNLGERVVNLHAPDMSPIACGALERTGQVSQTGPGQ